MVSPLTSELFAPVSSGSNGVVSSAEVDVSESLASGSFEEALQSAAEAERAVLISSVEDAPHNCPDCELPVVPEGGPIPQGSDQDQLTLADGLVPAFVASTGLPSPSVENLSADVSLELSDERFSPLPLPTALHSSVSAQHSARAAEASPGPAVPEEEDLEISEGAVASSAATIPDAADASAINISLANQVPQSDHPPAVTAKSGDGDRETFLPSPEAVSASDSDGNRSHPDTATGDPSYIGRVDAEYDETQSAAAPSVGGFDSPTSGERLVSSAASAATESKTSLAAPPYPTRVAKPVASPTNPGKMTSDISAAAELGTGGRVNRPEGREVVETGFGDTALSPIADLPGERVSPAAPGKSVDSTQPAVEPAVTPASAQPAESSLDEEGISEGTATGRLDAPHDKSATVTRRSEGLGSRESGARGVNGSRPSAPLGSQPGSGEAEGQNVPSAMNGVPEAAAESSVNAELPPPNNISLTADPASGKTATPTQPSASVTTSSVATAFEQGGLIGGPAPLQDQVVSALNDSMQSVEGDHHEMTVVLDPPELGVLKFALKRSAEGFEVRVGAADPLTSEMLQNRENEIKNELRDQGIDVTELSIQSDAGAGGDAFGGRQTRTEELMEELRRDADVRSSLIGREERSRSAGEGRRLRWAPSRAFRA